MNITSYGDTTSAWNVSYTVPANNPHYPDRRINKWAVVVAQTLPDAVQAILSSHTNVVITSVHKSHRGEVLVVTEGA